MGIRQQLNNNPVPTASVVGVLVLVALFVIFRAGCSGGGGENMPAVRQHYFTVDDGATWFPADARKLPPFEHQGKPAYRAVVYRCPHGKDFVSHLERYADADRASLQQLLDNADESGNKPPSADVLKLQTAIEIKKPGRGEWVKFTPVTAARFNAIRSPKCPEGKSEGLERRLP